MYKKHKDKENIFLNNFALGQKKETKLFNVTKKTENSSFNNINLGTRWLKKRSKEFNVDEKNYVKNK